MVVRIGGTGIGAQGSLVMLAGLIEVVLVCKNIGKIVMGGGIIRLKPQGLGVMSQGFVGLALVQEYEGEGGVRLGHARIQTQCHLAPSERLLIATLIYLQAAQLVP